MAGAQINAELVEADLQERLRMRAEASLRVS
jgi:hypothetical protein